MKSEFNKEYNKQYNLIKPIMILWLKRIYIIAFNIYAWYWLYREIFVRQTVEFEPYLLWFFTVTGMYYFVLENQNVYFKTNK